MTNAYKRGILVLKGGIYMYQEQRLEEIIKLLEDRGSLSAKEMVDYFQVSKDTIRRDFSILAKEKRAKRTHGGLLPIQKQRILGFQGRAEQSSKEKEKIAHLATQLISESQLIFYDVSTTVLELAKITDKKVTIFSHSLDNALILGGKENVDFHILGGRFHKKNRFYYSLEESDILNSIKFDLAFFGAASLSDGQVSFEDQEDVLMKKKAFKTSKTRVLLAETSKISKHSHFILSELADFDYWITDKEPDIEIQRSLDGKTTILF